MLGEATTTEAVTAPLGFGYKETLVASQKVNWVIEDIIGGDKCLDFSMPFMPDSLARTASLDFLSEQERLVLNQIQGHTYLSIFGLVEEFILPFVLDHVRPSLDEDDYRVRSFLQFAGEEAKHIQLFKVFKDEFERGFPQKCEIIGPASAIKEKILSYKPLAVALLILHIEWMTQRHYTESVKDDHQLDPLFKGLLKNHWLEEAQHAKLDTMMVETIADCMTEGEIERAVDDYLEIGGFLDEGFWQQANFGFQAFQAAVDRKVPEDKLTEFLSQMHQSNRWTYIGSGMTHPRFLETLGRLSSAQRERIEEIAPVFC